MAWRRFWTRRNVPEPEPVGGLPGPGDSADLIATADAQIQWSRNPGCFERRLQIRYKNPLFPAERRLVDQRELLDARKRDSEEGAAFRAEMGKQIEEVAACQVSQPISYAQADGFRRRVEALIQRASEIGPSVEQDRADLWEFWENIVKDIEEGVARWNVEADKALKAASAAHRLSKERLIRFGNFAAAQVVRKDNPVPPEDLLAFILSHDPDTIKQVMGALDPDTRALLRSLSAPLLRSALEEGLAPRQVEEKLKAISA